MIGKLTGKVDSFGEDWEIFDVNGVGYIVHCPARVLRDLPRAGETASLSIETYVREDQIRLFGFSGDLDREWFRMLMTVQGVGAKVALAILSVLKPSACNPSTAVDASPWTHRGALRTQGSARRRGTHGFGRT